jgi:alkanesulfonate monooxygenase SsuD/methylene tetrahydromethanopterin reductase-like flavin-dependent oxidoreductase (luciferase family)
VNLGLALRSNIFTPKESVELSAELRSFSYFLIPDVSNEVDPIALSLSILSKRDDCRAGSGVIRVFEHDLSYLTKQVKTVQSLTDNRFFLGVGTGTVADAPSAAIKRFVNVINSIRSTNAGLEIYAAALREKIARMVAGTADGIILNFSTFSHANRMARTFKSGGGKIVFSYLKIFVSWSRERAENLAKEEFIKYSNLPQYASLFEKEKILTGLPREITGKDMKMLQEKGVLLVNPSASEVNYALNFFVSNGVDVPVIYPYFTSNYTPEEKINYLKKLIG